MVRRPLLVIVILIEVNDERFGPSPWDEEAAAVGQPSPCRKETAAGSFQLLPFRIVRHFALIMSIAEVGGKDIKADRDFVRVYNNCVKMRLN
ncbi:hypothetical protein PUN28_008265 [Cardiocondyla obscurior]|uniref:Uncharacterized protein n=1 Tax=Cardiocondyla obscurior TaxID=286306 RepID=A0AAW2FZC3_9HYME